MSVKVTIPEVGESVTEVEILKWHKQAGDSVEEDEEIVQLETDKATVDLPSPAAGVLEEILHEEGDIVEIGETIATIGEQKEEKKEGKRKKEKAKKKSKKKEEEAQERKARQAADEEAKEESRQRTDQEEEAEAKETSTEAAAKEQADEGPEAAAAEEVAAEEAAAEAPGRSRAREVGRAKQEGATWVTPAARRALRRYGIAASDITAGQAQRLMKQDVDRYAREHELEPGAEEETERAPTARREEPSEGNGKRDSGALSDQLGEGETAKPMSLTRRRIAEHLTSAQQQAALLTTFNEIDMSEVVELRKRYKESFQETYDVRLGLMSFFVKAAVDALMRFPEVNAELRDKHIIYRDYCHIGIAISGKKGLIVPVLRYAEQLSFAEIEESIDDFAQRADGPGLSPQDLQGGTFTISNGGVFGSLLSTPIVNPPQSGVLGMHAIERRPVAVGDNVEIRPMMYVALTYDHRLIDGREAVSFLKRIKEVIEEPARMLIEV